MTHTMVLPEGRVLFSVMPPAWRAEARALKDRVEVLIPSWSLDHGWLKGRRIQDAEAVVDANPRWRFSDVRNCFSSVPQDRVWRLVHRLDASLARDLEHFCARLRCFEGLPEGTSFSPALVNLYLGRLDGRWQGRAIRVGDNWASCDRKKLHAELLDLGLSAQDRDIFLSGYTRPRAAASGGQVE